jgi:hypothetical protein
MRWFVHGRDTRCTHVSLFVTADHAEAARIEAQQNVPGGIVKFEDVCPDIPAPVAYRPATLHWHGLVYSLAPGEQSMTLTGPRGRKVGLMEKRDQFGKRAGKWIAVNIMRPGHATPFDGATFTVDANGYLCNNGTPFKEAE